MSNLDPAAVTKPVATWRKVVAAILDFIFVFAIVILYFIVFRRFLGGTVFQRLLGAR